MVGFIGGPPCPDFSVAGKNAGANGENGRLTNINLRLYNGLSSNELFPAHVRNIIPKQYHHSPMLIVEDDGCGMNDATLDDGFLKIATDIKSNEEGTLGEKGIGRLATQRLGTALLVETSSDKENHTSYVFIDWNDVINGTEEVPSFEGPVTSHHETLSVDPRKIQADSWQNNIGCGKIVYHYLERMHYE